MIDRYHVMCHVMKFAVIMRQQEHQQQETTLILTATCQVNLGKMIPACQTVLVDLAAKRSDRGGNGDSWNSKLVN